MEHLKTYKCKNCGGDLDYSKAVNGVLYCEFCGSVYTVPKSDSKAISYLDKGMAYLDTCEFDKSYTMYQKAAEIDKQEPEAYFGMALATAKVQYLKDHVNNRMQPICHDVKDKSFLQDENLKKALSFATAEQKKEYTAKANEIDSIRRQFYDFKKSGLNYDCFICVKVTEKSDTDSDKKRFTEDNTMAFKIYHWLKEAGYTPFYSEEEIKNRTGADYEALILYALHSAQSMLLVCTDEKYLQESPWVKNEYTRYLNLLGQEEKQLNSLTIVFKDRDSVIEKLPGYNSKIQGVPFYSPDAKQTIIEFADRFVIKSARKGSADNSMGGLKRNKVKSVSREEVKRQQARTIQTRSLQTDNEAENLSAQGEQLMRAINNFVRQEQFQRAAKFCNRWLKDNPTNYRDLEELIKVFLGAGQHKLVKKYVDYIVKMAPDRKKSQLWQLMIADGYSNIEKWATSEVPNKHISLEYMQKALPLISESEISVLYAFYDGIRQVRAFSEELKDMISYVLEFDVDVVKKYSFIEGILRNAIFDSTDNFAYFDFIITLLDDNEYNNALVNFANSAIAKKDINALNKILPMIEGDIYYKAHMALIEAYFMQNNYSSGVDETEKLLGYIKDEKEYYKKLDAIINLALTYLKPNNVKVADEPLYRLLSFTKEGNVEDGSHFARIAQVCCDARYRAGLQRYAKLLIGCGAYGKYVGYYYLMLLDLKCYSPQDIAKLKKDITNTKSFSEWMINSEGNYLDEVTKFPQMIDEMREQRRREMEDAKYDKKQIKDQHRTHSRAVKYDKKVDRRERRSDRLDRFKDKMSDIGTDISLFFEDVWDFIVDHASIAKIIFLVILAIAPPVLSITASVLYWRNGETGKIAGFMVPITIALILSYKGVIKQDSTFKVVISWIAISLALVVSIAFLATAV